jgi:plasmid stabilization system protein ParE
LDYKIFFSDVALIDLENVLEFIRENNPPAAERFGDALLNHVDLLATFPRLGVPMRSRPGIRKILHTPIRIYYRIHEGQKTVEVLHFWHGSRRAPKVR